MSLQEFVPPHSDEAEMAVLGSLMLSAQAVVQIMGLLCKEDFYLPIHQEIFGAAESLWAKRSAIDLLTVKTELGTQLAEIGGINYLTRVIDSVPAAQSARHYANLVKEKSVRRQTLQESHKTIQEINSDVPTWEAVASAQSRFLALTSSGAKEPRKVGEHSLEVLNKVERLMESGKVAGIETGFADVDRKTTGFSGGELILVAARPAMGKTSLVMNWAANMAAQGPVFFFSLEMSDTELTERLLAMTARVPLTQLRMEPTPETYEKLIAAAEQIQAMPLIVDDAVGLTPMRIVSMSKRYAHEHGKPVAIIVDYGQLMRADERSSGRVEEMTRISNGLKLAARELNTPIICLSQLSRESAKRENKRPQLTDLRDSGSWEQDADKVIFIHRERYYESPRIEMEEGEADVAEIIIAKQRNGPIGTVLLAFQEAYTLFSSLDKQSKDDYWKTQG